MSVHSDEAAHDDIQLEIEAELAMYRRRCEAAALKRAVLLTERENIAVEREIAAAANAVPIAAAVNAMPIAVAANAMPIAANPIPIEATEVQQRNVVQMMPISAEPMSVANVMPAVSVMPAAIAIASLLRRTRIL